MSTREKPGVAWRCGCRDEAGKLRWKTCERFGEAAHGSWGYRTSVTDPGTGRRRWITKFGFPTQAKAVTALNKVLRAKDDGALRHDEGMTLAAYLERWLERAIAAGDIRPTTARSYRGHIDHTIVPTIGAVRLRDLRKVHVNQMLHAATTKTDPKGKRRAPATVRRIHATLRAALSDAVGEELIATNPAAGAGLALPKATRPDLAPWEPAEVATFLDSVAEHRLGPLFEVAAFTGLRRGEVCGLAWEDVDLEAGVITVRRQLVAISWDVEERAPKTSKGVRRVDLADRAVDALKAQQVQQAEDAKAWGTAWHKTGRVFTREDGTDLHPERVSKTFESLTKRAELRVIRFHDLRHTAASLLIAAGTPIAVVSKMLGHSSIAVTVDVYGHLLEGVGTAAANKAADLVPAPSKRRHLKAV
ncbi:tyrosine-type recombinase/integrase [Demequina silvatica]|uniref:tyrosine-type recombinase/integrase n=1 Tax=Demequina silvatica TaxID=1638988 RepID=UPI0007826692|nr:site-specific integrase [Demequina silvatica]